MYRNARRFGCDQGTGHQIIGEAGFGRNHDKQLCNIGGQQFRFVLVRAVQQGLAFRDGFDHTLVRRRQLERDEITDRNVAFLAAGNTLQFDGVGLRQIMAAMCSDDSANNVTHWSRKGLLKNRIHFGRAYEIVFGNSAVPVIDGVGIEFHDAAIVGDDQFRMMILGVNDVGNRVDECQRFIIILEFEYLDDLVFLQRPAVKRCQIFRDFTAG